MVLIVGCNIYYINGIQAVKFFMIIKYTPKIIPFLTGWGCSKVLQEIYARLGYIQIYARILYNNNTNKNAQTGCFKDCRSICEGIKRLEAVDLATIKLCKIKKH